MNTELSSSSECFGLYDEECIIGFCAVIHFPHPVTKNIKTVHRLVVLPDYQGIGVGVKFLGAVAANYATKGYQFKIVTSAKNLIYALQKNNEWKCVRYGKTSPTGKAGRIQTHRDKIKTATFFYNR